MNIPTAPTTAPTVGIPTQPKPMSLRGTLMLALTAFLFIGGVGVANATLPACQHEDGSGQGACFWNAQTQGNGLGTSVTHDGMEAEAWAAWDASNAVSLVTHQGGFEVIYVAYNTTGWTLTESNEITVSSGGYHYLFTVHAS